MTTTKTKTLRDELNTGNPNTLGALARKMKLGDMLSPIKVTVTGLTAASAIDVTTAAVKAAAVVAGVTLETGENLPAIGHVVNLRVAASGTAASVGTYGVTDDGGTAIVPPGGASAAMGIAKLSDDGKTLTFPNTITGFVLTYWPRSATAMTTKFDSPAP
jgi:hypothetical protein